LKIYILPVASIVKPLSQPYAYPSHNEDYGVEQDFLIWLEKQSHLLTNNPTEADWHYLPVYWTRWHLNHNFAANGEGIVELQHYVDQVLLDDAKTFTITQFDGGTLLKLGKTLEFTAARTINQGIDIPILCSPHKKPIFPIAKKYKGSFNGSFSTHPIRQEMKIAFEEDPNLKIGGNLPTRFYKRWLLGKQFNLNTLASYIALCPRGTSCNSFRFFEAMQLGVAPCLIGDQDVRPFQKFIDWDSMSYYVSTVEELKQLLKNLNQKEALEKSKKAYQFWEKELF
jgi:hypothetical protein